jgi:hypothetical protein
MKHDFQLHLDKNALRNNPALTAELAFTDRKTEEDALYSMASFRRALTAAPVILAAYYGGIPSGYGRRLDSWATISRRSQEDGACG